MSDKIHDRWGRHWNEYPVRFKDTDFLSQVSKTQNRVPIGAEQVELIVGSLVNTLEVASGDRLLDLCCGNGLLTIQLAARCDSIVGVDFSRPLIEVARRHHAGDRVRYVLSSVLDIDAAALSGEGEFDKVYMYEALQHFTEADLPGILGLVSSLAGERDVPFLVASIPDRTRLFNFYDTPERRADYERRVRDGTEAVGTWWLPEKVASTATRCGYNCELRAQPKELYTAYYRFNALLRRR